MGIRGELFSTKVQLPNRTYFFNVKENRLGDLYLNIVESKNRETGGFERQSVVLFADDLTEFLQGFEESLKVLEKAVREKKRVSGRTARGREDEAPEGRRLPGKAEGRRKEGGETHSTGYEKKQEGYERHNKGRRVVVKRVLPTLNLPF
ncbi:MAG: DUF3276 family protein [Treponema sp.]|jgi:hypothetical protein|nr:DUF3276 family protein [Treponema sp.]